MGRKPNTNNISQFAQIQSTDSINKYVNRSIFNDNNLNKYIDFASWTLWRPDLFLDLLKPKEGGINLHADQRVFLRCATRFFSLYGCFPRG